MAQRVDNGGGAGAPWPRPIPQAKRRPIIPVPQGEAPASFRRAEKRARVARRSKRGSY